LRKACPKGEPSVSEYEGSGQKFLEYRAFAEFTGLRALDYNGFLAAGHNIAGGATADYRGEAYSYRVL
jgi:hypothetical protein